MNPYTDFSTSTTWMDFLSTTTINGAFFRYGYLNEDHLEQVIKIVNKQVDNGWDPDTNE
jgi:hypothetical protein